MKASDKKLIALIAAMLLLAIWALVGIIDYFRVSRFEPPLFCTRKASVYNGAEDYIHYRGLGYSFEVAENSRESEFPGVTRYTYFLLGNEVTSVIRD